MGTSILNPRSTRRIAGATGLDVVRAWGNGSYTHTFVTAGHQHGWFDVKTQQWGWEERPVNHKSSCRELFPVDFRELAEVTRGSNR